MRAALLFLLAVGSLRASNYFVTIAGLGGTPEYETQFKQWAAALDKALRANGSDCRVETMTGSAVTREAIRQVLGRIATEAQSDDSFALLLIGHGTFDGSEYKFNIPGPDVTAEEIAALLNRIPAARQLVVNMTSASGASLPVLARKNRVVITATKSGTEKNATVFARYWLDALQNSAADTDKNGSVSALEAYRYAQSKTAAYFQQEKLLATEHPMLDDTGAKEGVRDPGPNSQGLLAAAFPVIRPSSQTAAAVNPAKQKLVTKKEQLEAAIDRLKYQKAAMPPDEYKRQLSALLMELAKTQQEIDR
jgi:hypothetical protein